MLKQFVGWTLRHVLKRFGTRTERAIWLVLKKALSHKSLIFVVLGVNIAAAMFEGSSIGVLALAVASITTSDGTNTNIGPQAFSDFVGAIRMGLGREYFFLLLVAIAVVGQLLRAGLQYAGIVGTAFLQTRVMEELKIDVVRQIMRMSYAEVNKYPSGVLASFMNQSQRTAALLDAFNVSLSQVFLLLAYLALLVFISWQVTAIGLVLMIGFSVLLTRIIRRLRHIGKKGVRENIELSKRVIEYLQAPRLLRLYCKENDALARIKQPLRKGIEAVRQGLLLKGTITPVLESLTVIAAGLGLLGGFWILQAQSQQVLPILLAFVLVLHRLMTRVATLNNSRAMIANVLPAAEVTAEILNDEDKEFTRIGGASTGVFGSEIIFDSVSFSYSTRSRNVINNLSFTIPKGKVVALVGRSGSGKTTLVDLLLGLFEPKEGRILMNGIDLAEADLSEWRGNFGVVSQDSFMFNASISENIAFGRLGGTAEEIEEAAMAAHAHSFVTQLEDGYDTIIGDRGYRLSGGQIQRIALARALVTQANVLVLDEATSALDTVSESIIMQSIDELRGDRTIVIIAHRLSTVVNADEILMLGDGHISERGTHGELIAKRGRYSDLWRLQTSKREDRGAVVTA